MSWHYSRALVAEFSAAICSDGAPFAPSNMPHIPAAFYWPDKTTEHYRLSRFGMISEPLTGDLGAELLTWYRAAFPAKISASPARCGAAMESRASAAGYGANTCALLTNASRDLFGERIPQPLEPKGSTKLYKPFPSAGIYANGRLSALTIAASRISGNAYGFTLPTPLTRDWKDTPGMGLTRKDGKPRTDRIPMVLFAAVRAAGIEAGQATSGKPRLISLRGLPVEIAGKSYYPELPEWLMGWPLGWTDLKPLETDKFRAWRREHGKF